MSPHILIVDDSRTDAQLLANALIADGATDVMIFTTGSEVLRFLERCIETNSTLPGVLIIDFTMQEIGGIDILRAMKLNQKFKEIIRVIYTGGVPAGMTQRCLELGAHAVMVKPYDDQERQAIIGKLHLLRSRACTK